MLGVEKKYVDFTQNKEHDYYYWSLASAVVGASQTNLFRKKKRTGNLITSSRYVFTDNGLVICFDAVNQSDTSVLFSDDDMAFFVNGKRLNDSEISFVVPLKERILKRGDKRMLCWLYESDTYHSYEDYVSMKLRVYLNNSTLGLARIFPTVGPAIDDNDDLRESSDALYKLEWPHVDKEYTSNDWLFDLNGVESYKDAKDCKSQVECLEKMHKEGVY